MLQVYYIIDMLVRYEREIKKRETPAIRMILEGFPLPPFALVLVVVDYCVSKTDQGKYELFV
jgi:hypothetical protein